MSRVKVLQISGKDVLWVDYSGCKTDQMIQLFDEAKEVVLKGNRKILILTNFEKTFITPAFLQHVRPEMQKVKHLVKRNAFIGMTLPQRMILKGFALFIGKKEFVAFDTYQDAVDYLVNDTMPDLV